MPGGGGPGRGGRHGGRPRLPPGPRVLPHRRKAEGVGSRYRTNRRTAGARRAGCCRSLKKWTAPKAFSERRVSSLTEGGFTPPEVLDDAGPGARTPNGRSLKKWTASKTFSERRVSSLTEGGFTPPEVPDDAGPGPRTPNGRSLKKWTASKTFSERRVSSLTEGGFAPPEVPDDAGPGARTPNGRGLKET